MAAQVSQASFALNRPEGRWASGAIAQPGRALEINTRLPLHATILTWWHEEGGDAVFRTGFDGDIEAWEKI
jgi:hypothetical protein